METLHFAHLPDFALYILQYQFDAFERERRKIIISTCLSNEFCSSILFATTSHEYLVKGLQYLVDNNIEGYLENLKNCFLNEIFRDCYKEEFKELIVTLGSIERQSFYTLIFAFSNDSNDISVLLKEIDRLSVQYEFMMCHLKADQLIEDLHRQYFFNERIAHAIPGLISIFDVINKEEIYSNNKVEAFLGYHEEDRKRMKKGFVEHIFHPDDLPRAYEDLRNFIRMEKNEVKVSEYRILHKNGQYLWFRYYICVFNLSQNNTPRQIITLALNIQSEKEAQEKINEQQYFIQYLADASPAILCLLDFRTGKVKYINREVFHSLGYLPAEVMYMDQVSLRSMVYPDDVSQIRYNRKKFESHIENDKVVKYECRIRHKLGHWCWILFYEVVFKRDSEGRPVEVLISALDITQRKKTEQDLHEKNIKLQQSNRLLEEFAYIASHDLQEPLRKMSIFGDIMKKFINESLHPEAYRALQKILNSSGQMQNLIRDVMSISQVSVDKGFEKYNMQVLLNEALEELEGNIKEVRALINFVNLPEAFIIPSQIKQLFVNLIGNSLKYIRSENQPQITLNYSYVRPQEVRQYELKEARQYLKIIFSDNGIGFDNEFAEKIFVIFQRLHAKTDYPGTGIGLAICRKIVQNHGGAIKAFGRPGVGAEFTVYLPE